MNIQAGSLVKELFGSRESALLDRAKLARESIGFSQDGKQDEARLTELFAIGGKNGEGLFPDFDHNGRISATDIRELAAKSGKKDQIEESDLQKAFPEQFQPRESLDDPQKLKRIANDDTDSCNYTPEGTTICTRNRWR